MSFFFNKNKKKEEEKTCSFSFDIGCCENDPKKYEKSVKSVKNDAENKNQHEQKLESVENKVENEDNHVQNDSNMFNSFKKFDLDDFDIKHLFGLVFGISGSGKSFMVKELIGKIRKKKYYKDYVLISPTEKLSHSFGCFNEKDVYESFSNDFLREVIQKRKKSIEKKEKKPKPILIVIDDCAADPAMRNSPALNELFISGRHINVGVIILLQNINARDSVPPPIRNNATLLMCSKPRKFRDREFLVREWFSMGSEKEGHRILNSLTEDRYRFAVANLQKFATASTYDDFISSYKAGANAEVEPVEKNLLYDTSDIKEDWKKNDELVLSKAFV